MCDSHKANTCALSARFEKRQERGRKNVMNVGKKKVSGWKEIIAEGGAGDAGVTFREEKLLWVLLSAMSSKKGCRLGGAVTAWLGSGTPLVSR